MKRFNKIFAVALAILTVVLPMTVIPANAATHSAYYNELLALGFTDSYATRLEELHKMHPSWVFEPVMITKLNSKFTYTYVTNSENKKTGSTYYNLVTNSTWAPSPWNSLGKKNYTPYYDANVTTLFDSGWRKASLPAIKYFMDPRNFLNDVDIFMFETLEFNAATQTVDRVAAALKGSFMGDGAKCDNGKTYAQYIWEVGKANNISPVFLASRLKQEQGAGGSPLVKGTIGTKLYSYYKNKPSTDNGDPVWGTVKKTATYTKSYLLGFDGYYNFFNIGACGTGRFAIFLNGGKEAKEGGWNTKAKAISGGAKKIAAKYVGDYQDTLYFQKFNTDPRSSRVLWGQYMQNISAPLTEGRNTRKTYASEGVLEEAYVFKIPVYGGMSTTPYADPAKGNSYYSPSKSTGYTGGGSSPYAPTAKTYTVRYDANGGTGTMADTIVTYGTSTALRANTFTRTGYDFAGWYRYRTSDNKWYYSNGTSSGWYVEGSQPSGYTKTILADKSKVAKTSGVDKDICIFYAAWTAHKYTVKFNANGGTGTMSGLAMTYGTAKALTKNAFTRSGYTFLGWAKTADAAAPAYTDAQSVKNLTSAAGGTVTLYAVWQSNAKTFTVQYDANGGTGTMADTIVTYGTSTALRANTFTRTGYDFKGWYRYRTSDNKWYYSNGTSSGWYVEGSQPSGYTKTILADKSKVAKTSGVDKDICIFYAVWQKKAETQTTTYLVRCGVFSAKTNATALVTKLTNKGFDAYVKQEGSDYRVYAGTYSVKSNATAQVTKLKNAGFDAVVVTVTK